MIVSITKKTISLAISLLVVVISLTGVAMGANAPAAQFSVQKYDQAGFSGAPGKMARDAAGNFYVTDFWGKGIVKLNRNGGKIGFIATLGRPSAVAVLPDNRLVVAMATPQPYVAFYSQIGSAPNVTGEEISPPFTSGTGVPLYRPVAITIDQNGRIYVLDSGDTSGDKDGFEIVRVPASIYRGNVKVYSPAGAWLHEFGERTYPLELSTAPYYFKLPQGIAYEKAAHQIVVADTQNGRLQYFGESNGTTCTHAKSIGSLAGQNGGAPATGSAAGLKFYNPVDIAFEYNDSNVLQRVYVADKGRNQISVVNAANDFFLGSLNGTSNGTIVVSGAAMKNPAAVLFERTGTGASTAGVLYITNEATASAANIMALGLDGGTVPPAATVAMVFDPPVPAVSPSTPITVFGTTNPGTAVTCTVNGVDVVSTSSGNASWTVSGLDLQSGMNYIRCSSTTGGAYVEASTYYGAPTTAPAIAITQPSGTIYSRVSTVTVSGTTTPGNATVQLVNSAVGSDIIAPFPSDASGTWSKVVTLKVGDNVISATASRPGTAVSDPPVSRAVVYDATDPIMTVSFIAPGTSTTTAVQNLDGIVDEANLQSITVNGVPVPAQAKVTMPGNKTYFSIPVIQQRGSNTVSVVATDLAGRSTTDTRSVTLAPEKTPAFTVALPADNTFRAVADISESASGTAGSGYNSVVACDGSSVTPVAGNWSATTANIGAGFFSCQFIATGGGNTVNEKRTFITNGVKVAITSPTTDKATNAPTIKIAGAVNPGAATPQIQVNGGALTPVAGYTSGTGIFTDTDNNNIVTLTPGVNIVKIISNGTTAIRNIIYDTAKPELTILADSKPMPASVTGSIDPNAKLTVTTWVGTTPTVVPISKITSDQSDQSVWYVDLSGIAYDKVIFTATDPAGNSYDLTYKPGIPTGDIDEDGTVRLADALAALRHVAGTEVINPLTQDTKYFNGDVGGLVKGRVARDGVIDISDAVLILNKAYGLMAF